VDALHGTLAGKPSLIDDLPAERHREGEQEGQREPTQEPDLSSRPGPARPATLAVVIVSYNVRELLGRCLESVFASAARSPDWLRVDVLVVDNASQDGSPQMVAQEFPQVRLMALDENLGFAGANNRALRALGFGEASPLPQPLTWLSSSPLHEWRGEGVASSASRGRGEVRKGEAPDLVLLLNPDTELVDDALGRMAAFLRDHPRAGACGAHLRYGDGRFQHGAFRFPGLMQVALDLLPWDQAPGLRRLLPRLLDSRLNGRYPRRLWEGQEPFPVDFVLGAALMVRAEAMHQVGLLDEGYFMYCEEMDWCLRLGEAGWTVHALPGARVIHHEGQSSRQIPWTSFRRLWRSRFRFYAKHRKRYPRGFVWGLRGLVRTGLALRGWLARRRFAQGKISGQELAEELAAYEAVERMAGSFRDEEM